MGPPRCVPSHASVDTRPPCASPPGTVNSRPLATALRSRHDPSLRLPSFLVGMTAHNQHAQNIARALYESGALYAYMTGGVDHYRSTAARLARRVAGIIPTIDRELGRRA